MRWPMRKASKSEVDYSRGHAGAHCGKALDDDRAYCQYFIPSPLAPFSDRSEYREAAAGELLTKPQNTNRMPRYKGRN